MINVAIVGATGYTGVELMRFLIPHPEVNIKRVTSRSEVGKHITHVFPNLRGHLDLCFEKPEVNQLKDCDLVFFATPNGTAMQTVPALLKQQCKIIDLAADFRITDKSVWETWYQMQHACPELLSEAVYGLPEINRKQIKVSQLVANPGCYPTATILGFLPLLANQCVDISSLIADTKSGVSGAGKKAAIGSLLCEAGENVKAYATHGHRHHPEISQILSQISGEKIGLIFMPHLMPMIRGIHATLYAKLNDPSLDLQQIYTDYYHLEPFVDVLPSGINPETRHVKGSNFCHMSIINNHHTAIVLSVIDNLVKGAAGQAVQNMNIMFDFDEMLGLHHIALNP